MLYHNSPDRRHWLNTNFPYKPIYPNTLINHRNGKKFRTCNLNVSSCKNSGAWIGIHRYGIPKCCYAILSSMVKNISTILYKNKIHYWLMDGALLGIIRSGDLTIHDNDIDFGIFRRDRHKLLSASVRKDFSKIGYNIRRNGCHAGAEIRPKHNGMYTEVFVYSPDEKDGDFGSNSLGVNLYGWFSKGYRFSEDLAYRRKNRMPRSFFETLDTINYQGCNVKVPKNPKKYLRFKYGPNWINRSTNWNQRQWFCYSCKKSIFKTRKCPDCGSWCHVPSGGGWWGCEAQAWMQKRTLML